MTDLNRPGIYRIANTTNGKVYVGSAVNLRRRWNGHRRLLRLGEHHSRPLQAAWNKYGESAFSFAVIEDVSDPKLLIDMEQKWLDTLESGRYYNVCLVAGSSLGKSLSPETRKKISQAKTGKPNGQLGAKRTPEQVARIAAGQMGKKMPRHAVEKTRAAHIGRKNTPETLQRMKAAALRRWEEKRNGNFDAV
jgi:group I intron endonuclease